ncbi:MAG TPA: RdgB/HAM1 family non-canonical purine NTP pyrophosphatase [Pantanalinema sp.]
MQVYLATTNAHKLSEFKPLLTDAPFDLSAMPEAVEVEETGSTFVANARLKARQCAERFEVPCLADDSGIAVEALDGRPGIASARYAESDADRINKLLAELEGKASRAATFHCAVVLAYPDGREIAVEGVVKGRVTEAPRGTGGFGYDPVFEVEGLGKTYAELSADEKNVHSHRARAVRLLLEAMA